MKSFFRYENEFDRYRDKIECKKECNSKCRIDNIFKGYKNNFSKLYFNKGGDKGGGDKGGDKEGGDKEGGDKEGDKEGGDKEGGDKEGDKEGGEIEKGDKEGGEIEKGDKEGGEIEKGEDEKEEEKVKHTFQYLFHKFKKGIYVKIRNNQIVSFLPFSKYNYTNEWGSNIKVDKTKYSSIIDLIKYSSKQSGYTISTTKINYNPSKWYGNNYLVRTEYPINERETNVDVIKDMLTQLCLHRSLPDIEFFLNRRDFPLLKKDLTEPYDALYNKNNLPLKSHSYSSYCPIFSMVTTNEHADICVPTFVDWNRVNNTNGKSTVPLQFKNKIQKAVFRGSNTGSGTNLSDNVRLRLASMIHEDLDVGITKWNTRVQVGKEYLDCLNVSSLPFGLVQPLSYEEQANYKYIINIDGHVSAYRLTHELGFGSVILLNESNYKMWFTPFLKEYVHFVPIKNDLSDLLTQIQWCKNNESICCDIADNAKIFYTTYLHKDSIFDFYQALIHDLCPDQLRK
jgi:hypothetical protein